jgi:2-C-methyl-D-erythritol 4-phosphate cytidylyltransferase
MLSQVIKPDILSRAFQNVRENNLEVTDDVSMVEELGLPVRCNPWYMFLYTAPPYF